MAILNVTPDSFFAGSRMPDATHVERRVREAVAEGASIIDVGGYSSRPGADEVSRRRGVAARGAGHRGRAASGARRPDFGRYLPQRSRRPCDRKIRSAHHQRHLRRGTRSRRCLPRRALRRALRRHAHEGRSRTMQTLTDYKRDITAEVVAYFEARTATCSPPGSHASISSSTPVSASPRPRNRITNCSPGFTASVRWAIPYWRALAQVDDLPCARRHPCPIPRGYRSPGVGVPAAGRRDPARARRAGSRRYGEDLQRIRTEPQITIATA